MEIIVDRFTQTESVTFSEIIIDKITVCFGLEDIYREKKVHGKTRIPEGTYDVNLRTVGGFHKKYTNKFKDTNFKHKGMLWVRDVPKFKYILIHIGNYAKNTDGCLLLGSSFNPHTNMVNSSKSAYTKFYPLVVAAAEANDLTIRYIDNDR